MRVIFLDVDGVLNCALTTDRYKGMMGLDFSDTLKSLGIDPNSLPTIEEVLQKKRGKI